jgi:hypothetical protein
VSLKWQQTKAWDDEHLKGWLLPVKWVLRAFSSITMAVVLLSLLTLYGVMASVPIGMLAMAPTYAVYGVTALAAVGLAGILPAWAVWSVLRRRGAPLSTRFPVVLAVVGVGSAAGAWAWASWVLPVLWYNPATGEGVRFFADFVERYRGVPLRRLPGLEMSELEFYAWWPMNLILYLFVLNMIVATVRRIEFRFENLGVLTVHTGIVVIALGGAYYSLLKVEGNVLLRANYDERTGRPAGLGPVERGFFDNTRSVLRVVPELTPAMTAAGVFPRMEQRLLHGLPRYNAYGLNSVGAPVEGADDPLLGDRGRSLSLEVRPMPPAPASPEEAAAAGRVDPDIRFRIVGFAPYAELRPAWRAVPPGATIDTVTLGTARSFEIRWLDPSAREGEGGRAAGPESGTLDVLLLEPDLPSGRWGRPSRPEIRGLIAVEHTRGMAESRWRALTSATDRGDYVLRVEVPASGGGGGVPEVTVTQAVTEGTVLNLAGGWRVEVLGIEPRNALPFLTPGYEDAQTSVARVRVSPPTAGDGRREPEFTRWVHHRFPERDQDIIDDGSGGPMGGRRTEPTPRIRMSLIDQSVLQVYVDQTSVGVDGRARFRAAVRLPRGGVSVVEDLPEGGLVPVGDRMGVVIGPEWKQVAGLRLVPPREQDNRAVGTRQRAAVAVEVSSDRHPGWRRAMWLPHIEFDTGDPERMLPVRLPDGRAVRVAVARLWHAFPDGMGLALRDFEMLPYPHSDQPRDFRSDVVILRGLDRGEARVEQASTSMNAPLLASSWTWDTQRAWVVNALGWIGSRIGPTQFKFSQNSWDPQTWHRTRAMAETGELERPYVQFTILGVGNNPGYWIIFLGGILVTIGIPWAFYVKPWILRRRKAKIQRELAAKAGEGSVERGTGQAASAAGAMA